MGPLNQSNPQVILLPLNLSYFSKFHQNSILIHFSLEILWIIALFVYF